MVVRVRHGKRRGKKTPVCNMILWLIHRRVLHASTDSFLWLIHAKACDEMSINNWRKWMWGQTCGARLIPGAAVAVPAGYKSKPAKTVPSGHHHGWFDVSHETPNCGATQDGDRVCVGMAWRRAFTGAYVCLPQPWTRLACSPPQPCVGADGRPHRALRLYLTHEKRVVCQPPGPYTDRDPLLLHICVDRSWMRMDEYQLGTSSHRSWLCEASQRRSLRSVLNPTTKSYGAVLSCRVIETSTTVDRDPVGERSDQG